MNGVRITKFVKEIKFERVWGELGAKSVSRDSLKNFLFLFISLLIAPVDKNSHIQAYS